MLLNTSENEDLQTAQSNLFIVLPESGLSLVEGNIATYISGFVKRFKLNYVNLVRKILLAQYSQIGLNKQHSFLSAKIRLCKSRVNCSK